MCDNPNTALALSRWDLLPNGELRFFDCADSQDVWVIRGCPKGFGNTDFPMGYAGCDNRFAYELRAMGYEVRNLGRSMVTIHYHLSGIRNYIDESGNKRLTVPEPYLLVKPEDVKHF